MKTSNVKFYSNIFVMSGNNKLSDSNFMSHVLDPGAVREIADNQRKWSGTIDLSPLHQSIYNNAIPCSYSSGDYSHGSVIENGEIISVNKCEATDCQYYHTCSEREDFRKIARDEDANFDFAENVPVNSTPIHFDIQFPNGKVPINLFTPKVNFGKLTYKAPDPIIEIRTNNTDEWSVRGHIRHLSSGGFTYVRPHTKHHLEGETLVIKRSSAFRIRKKPYINKKLLERLLQKKTEQPIVSALNQDFYQLQHIVKIESATKIIEANVDSRILVNAGPGTGKTHTVIERLKYLLKQDEIDAESILVLCFSRSAVKVIRDRLAESMANGEIPYTAKRIDIWTFDSFATLFLMSINARRDLSYYSYDERIAKFIQEFLNDVSIINNAIQYLIIDEIQDLVGIRAKLVKTLLDNVTCGYLLLGDECQAIYDYQISDGDDLSASKLYKWLEERFGDSLTEYELTNNWRQTQMLESKLMPLRKAMLFAPFIRQKQEINRVFSAFDIPDMTAEDIIECCSVGDDSKKAILSWSNGDAYRQSQELYLRDDIDVHHNILTGSRRLVFRKELAAILGEYGNDRISFGSFVSRGQKKGIALDLLNKLWNAFIYVNELAEDADEISVSMLKRNILSERRIDETLLWCDDSSITISTIHKAKGKEYDIVLLNQFGNISNADDIKVYYVALTRAKNEVIVKKHKTSKRDYKMPSGRFIEVGSNNQLTRVELGIDGDIDPVGFVDATLSNCDSPEMRQKYICDNVKCGDPITISKSGSKYLIMHNGHCIGELNSGLFEPFRHYYPNGTYYTYYFDKYLDFKELYVKDVVTIVNQKLDTRIAEPYKSSGFWYGVEFCGYAKPMEE